MNSTRNKVSSITKISNSCFHPPSLHTKAPIFIDPIVQYKTKYATSTLSSRKTEVFELNSISSESMYQPPSHSFLVKPKLSQK